MKNLLIFVEICAIIFIYFRKEIFIMAKKNNSELFSSILYILIGVLLVIFKGETLNWAMTIAGIFFIVSGVLEVVKKNYHGGAVSLVIGIAILILGWLAVGIVLLVLGILLAVKGGVALIDALKSKKPNALDIVYPALTIALGVLIALGEVVSVLIVIAGVLLIIDGALGLLAEVKKSK